MVVFYGCLVPIPSWTPVLGLFGHVNLQLVLKRGLGLNHSFDSYFTSVHEFRISFNFFVNPRSVVEVHNDRFSNVEVGERIRIFVFTVESLFPITPYSVIESSLRNWKIL